MRATGKEYDPAQLRNDGEIVFSSTRRRGYARCFGAQFSSRWHVYTLHRMAADGTNPSALWGNATPSPHCTFHIEPIPGSSKIVFIAAPHHSIAAGSVAVLDPAPTNDGPAALTRITPEVPFPEAESMEIREYYEAPWPLSEAYFLVAYSPRPLVWEPGANDPRALGRYLFPRGTVKELRIVHIFLKTTPVANEPPIGLAGEENARAILGTVPIERDGSARFCGPNDALDDVCPAGRARLLHRLP